MGQQQTTADPALDRVVWALAAAVLGLVVREVWQAWRQRDEKRKRDRLILTGLAREVLIIKAIAAAIVQDLNRERVLLSERERWRLKPLVALPTGIYDLVRSYIPRALLEQDEGFVQLIGLQIQCEFTNQLAHEQQNWKSPAARGSEQLEIIVSFHAPLEESIVSVSDRCVRLLTTLEAAATKVGGLDLKRLDSETSSKAD